MSILIVLVSGTGLRSDLRLLKYWGRVPGIIKRHGLEVLLLHPDAFGSISANVELMSGQLNEFLLHNRFDEVHVFGHSRGGVEALYFMQQEYLAKSITSITMLHTPVTGHSKARKITSNDAVLTRLLYWLGNLLGRIQGDKHPDSKKLAIELGCNHLDKLFKDSKIKVYLLQSGLKHKELPFVWKILSGIFYPKSELGDGLIPYQVIGNQNVIEIPSKSIANQPLTHTSTIGVTKVAYFSKIDLKDVWDKLIHAVVFKSNI